MLDGKVIGVTGASRGLGLAIAAAVARHGGAVLAGYRTDDAAIRAIPGDVLPVRLDVRSEDDVAAAIQAANARWGRIDGWVNCAGVLKTGLLVSTDAASDAELLEVNLLGAIRCTRAVLPGMIRRRSGVVLFVSSVAAERPTRGQAVYAATKGAVEAFARGVAVEVGGRGVRAVCLRPGPIDTEMLAGARALSPGIERQIPLGRIPSANEVAEIAALFLSDQAAYLTGVVIPVDGGWTANGTPG